MENMNSNADELLTFNVKYGKETIDIDKMDISSTVLDLKKELEQRTLVPIAMQKLMFKGLLKDDQRLSETKLKKGCKVMLVGSSASSILAATAKPLENSTVVSDFEATAVKSVPLCQQQPHKKYLADGPPKGGIPGRGGSERLPGLSLPGILNHRGVSGRLSFKPDSVWIGTKERTQKVPFLTVRKIHDYPIDGYDEHCILGLQIGATEKSMLYIYFVPKQFVSNIKALIIRL